MNDNRTYYHGTKANLEIGDLIAPGYASQGAGWVGSFCALHPFCATQ